MPSKDANGPLFTCKLAEIPTGRTISGSDACKPGRPARMTADKLKLHYFVHYMHRGTWDILVPEEKEENLGKIEAYHCNLCPRRFRNNHDKKSYPGRGSIMCHLATEHGHLLKAMREDDKVDMTSEIEAIDANDNGKWVALGLPEVPDEEMYTAKESFMWKYQQRRLNGETEKDKKPPPKPQECPHCNDCKGNTDASRLRLHVFHHYKDRWEHRLDALEKGQNYFYCNMCPKRKQLRGANEEGARMSTICHFAIQHQELRDVLAKDERLPENFVKDLYYDIDLKEGRITENNATETEKPSTTTSETTKPVLAINKPKESVQKIPEPVRGRRSKSGKKPKDEWLSSDSDDDEEFIPKSKVSASKRSKK